VEQGERGRRHYLSLLFFIIYDGDNSVWVERARDNDLKSDVGALCVCIRDIGAWSNHMRLNVSAGLYGSI
jgi:hypothetical protein